MGFASEVKTFGKTVWQTRHRRWCLIGQTAECRLQRVGIPFTGSSIITSAPCFLAYAAFDLLFTYVSAKCGLRQNCSPRRDALTAIWYRLDATFNFTDAPARFASDGTALDLRVPSPTTTTKIPLTYRRWHRARRSECKQTAPGRSRRRFSRSCLGGNFAAALFTRYHDTVSEYAVAAYAGPPRAV